MQAVKRQWQQTQTGVEVSRPCNAALLYGGGRAHIHGDDRAGVSIIEGGQHCGRLAVIIHIVVQAACNQPPNHACQCREQLPSFRCTAICGSTHIQQTAVFPFATFTLRNTHSPCTLLINRLCCFTGKRRYALASFPKQGRAELDLQRGGPHCWGTIGPEGQAVVPKPRLA